MKEILNNIHLLTLGGVNAYLIDHGALTLIDTGYAGNGKKIIDYIKKLGKLPTDLENIIITHLHTDHSGSLAEIKALTQAKVYMHIEDAKLVEKGISFREKLETSPGVFNKIIYNLAVKNAPKTITPTKVDHYIQMEDDYLPIGQGFKIISVPGHSKGQIALLYQAGEGILFAADTTGNVLGMGIAPFYEDYLMGIKDINKLSKYQFENILFGHGSPIIGNAALKFRKQFRKFIQADAIDIKSKIA